MKPLNQWTKSDLIAFIKSVDTKTWVKIAGGVVVIILLWFFFIKPAWFDRPKLRREVEIMSNEMRLFHAMNQKRMVWLEDEKAYTRIIQDAESRAYQEDEVALLLGQVSRLANTARADIVASRPSAETIEFPEPYNVQYEAIPYDFTVQGGYHSFGELAEGIETYPKLLRIQSIHIVPLKNESNKLIASFVAAAIAEKTEAA